MLFDYLCTLVRSGIGLLPNRCASKDAGVYSGHDACGIAGGRQQEHTDEHAGPDAGGDEERIIRGYRCCSGQAGFGRSPSRCRRGFDSPWGPSIVVERAEDPATGTYLLLRLFPHGYKGKAFETGTDRKDVPKVVAGKV